MRFTTADKITVMRLWLLPIAVGLYYVGAVWAYFISALVFLIIAISDFLDGYVARKMGEISAFGAFLDPVADKVCVVVMLIVLASHFSAGHFYIGLFLTCSTLVISSREIIVSALREFMAMRGLRDKVAVKTLGKWKTFAQCIAIILLTMTSGYFSPDWLYHVFLYLGLFFLLVAATLTVVSLFTYLKSARQHLSS